MTRFLQRCVLPALSLIALGARDPVFRPQPPAVVGCYRADRPLGTSAASIDGRAIPGDVGRAIGEDSTGLVVLTTFRLLEGGSAARPGAAMENWWNRGSTWRIEGDTLHVTLSTRTSGWTLRLTRRPGRTDAWSGIARYLTDVVVDPSQWRPPEAVVNVERTLCGNSP